MVYQIILSVKQILGASYVSDANCITAYMHVRQKTG